MNWYITKRAGKGLSRNAAGKAPGDIDRICEEIGWGQLGFPVFPAHWKNQYLQKAWILTLGTFPWLMAERKVKEKDVILLQYPFYGNRVIEKMVTRIQKQKNCKFILLLHDLESLRNQKGQELDKGRLERGLYAEKKLLPLMDMVICHNDVMKEYLVSQGIPEEKLVSLQIFDYLTDCNPEKREQTRVPSVCIAGNLNPIKSSYIYGITDDAEALKVNLFGIGYQEEKGSPCHIYHGSFPSDTLPDQLKGNFGLVWDGHSAKTCAGGTGEYLRYNNPHKTSLYLASNLPVVLWEEAALASFVKEKGVGITVCSLSELSAKIGGLSAEEYDRLQENARREGEKLRSGYYTRHALDEAITRLQKKDQQ